MDPTSADVHVDAMMGGQMPPNQKKKKPNMKEGAMTAQMLKIVKVDDEQRMAYGWASVIAIKGVPYEDVQGDIIDAPTLEKAVGDFMFDVRRSMAMHERNAENKIDDSMVKGTVIHSMPLTPEIKKALGIESEMDGWVVGVKVLNDDVWKRIKSGELASLSIGGRGYRVPVENVDKGSTRVDKVLGTTVKDYIDDFLASDAPQFRGKSKEEIIQMALAAWYGGKSIDYDEIHKAYGDNAVEIIADIVKSNPAL